MGVEIKVAPSIWLHMLILKLLPSLKVKLLIYFGRDIVKGQREEEEERWPFVIPAAFANTTNGPANKRHSRERTSA